MSQGKLDAFDDLRVTTVTGFIHDFDSHDLGSRGDACLDARVALSGNDTGAVGAVHIVVHGVVVVVDDVVAVVWELRTAVPHAACNVNVVVVDSGVENGNDNTVPVVTCRAIVTPHCRGVDFVHVPGVVPGFDWLGFTHLRKHGTELVLIYVSHVATGFDELDGFVGGHAGKGVDSPERLDALHLAGQAFNKLKHLLLRGLAEGLMVSNDERPALGFVHKLGLAGEACLVILLCQHYNVTAHAVFLTEKHAAAQHKKQEWEYFFHKNKIGAAKILLSSDFCLLSS